MNNQLRNYSGPRFTAPLGEYFNDFVKRSVRCFEYFFRLLGLEIKLLDNESYAVLMVRYIEVRLYSLFRSRKNFLLLMQSWRFFSPDLFMKISNFSKTVHTIFMKFCTTIPHPKGPLRARSHQNCMTGM